jgi:hypothetical protein
MFARASTNRSWVWNSARVSDGRLWLGQRAGMSPEPLVEAAVESDGQPEDPHQDPEQRDERPESEHALATCARLATEASAPAFNERDKEEESDKPEPDRRDVSGDEQGEGADRQPEPRWTTGVAASALSLATSHLSIPAGRRTRTAPEYCGLAWARVREYHPNGRFKWGRI